MNVLSYCFVILGILGESVQGELLGKLMFHGNDELNDGSSLRILHKPDSVNFAPAPGPIRSDEVGSVMALSLGLSIPKDITWAGLQFGDLFNRPRAVMMFTIDGLPENSELKLSAERSFPIKSNEETSIEELYAITKQSSLASHVNAIFSGQSNTISMAAEKSVAASGYGNGKLSKACYWNDVRKRWEMVVGDEEKILVELKTSDLQKKLHQFLPYGFTYDTERSMIMLDAKGMQVEFSVDDEIDFAVFSELLNIMEQYEQVSTSKGYADGIPDVYLFAITALKGLERKYGADSKQLHGALYLMEKVIPKIVEDFKKLYDGKILIVGATLQSTLKTFKEHQTEINKVIENMKQSKNIVTDAFHQFLPEVHVPSHIETSARERLCQELQGSLTKLAGIVKFKCSNAIEVRQLSRRSLLGTVEDKDASDYNIQIRDDTFPAIFNIILWLVIILALALYVISLSMWFMDPGRDSIIYRLTQTKVKPE